jgi:PHD/YefM family antitoxin component YafN of YafNO toxin-antitoxin module
VPSLDVRGDKGDCWIRSEFHVPNGGPVFKTSDVYSLTDFQRSAREHIQRLRDTRRPEVLTVNGKAEVVVQDADAYQDLLDRLDRAESIVGINRGLVSMRRGEGIPAEEALDALRSQLGVGVRVD